MPFSTAVADPLLKWMLGTPMPAPPAALHMALHSQAQAAIGNDVSGQLGGRVLLDPAWFGAPKPAVGVDATEITNSQAIVFGNAVTALSIKSFAIWDASSNGNLLFHGDVIPDVQLRAGDPAIFSPGDVIIRVGQAIVTEDVTPFAAPALVA
jgi:hypothetical protein